jgi:hypothetical protein
MDERPLCAARRAPRQCVAQIAHRPGSTSSRQHINPDRLGVATHEGTLVIDDVRSQHMPSYTRYAQERQPSFGGGYH